MYVISLKYCNLLLMFYFSLLLLLFFLATFMANKDEYNKYIDQQWIQGPPSLASENIAFSFRWASAPKHPTTPHKGLYTLDPIGALPQTLIIPYRRYKTESRHTISKDSVGETMVTSYFAEAIRTNGPVATSDS